MTARRSVGKTQVARALWYAKPRRIELRAQPLPPVGPSEARVRTLYSAISRGTERLVFEGAVSETEWQRMRAPAQEGNFPFPVKYGYCATGVVEEGPDALLGRTVFALHPHQDTFVLPADRLVPVPEGVPERRATLAANMETALNAHWDAGTGPGDRIVVVGAGVVGLLVASIAARLPGAEVTVVDTNPARREIIEAMGCRFSQASAQEGLIPSADVVFHASAREAGLATAIAAAGMEARVVELSWYGDKPVTLGLGGAFHSQRLQMISSQVGQVSPSRRPRWPYRRRLEAALRLLADPVLDALVADGIAFDDAPQRLPEVFAATYTGLAPVLSYR